MGDIDTQAAQVASRNPYVVDDNSLPQHVQFNHVKNHIAQKYHIDQIGISKSSVDNSSYSDKHGCSIDGYRQISGPLNSMRDGFGSGWSYNPGGNGIASIEGNCLANTKNDGGVNTKSLIANDSTKDASIEADQSCYALDPSYKPMYKPGVAADDRSCQTFENIPSANRQSRGNSSNIGQFNSGNHRPSLPMYRPEFVQCRPYGLPNRPHFRPLRPAQDTPSVTSCGRNFRPSNPSMQQPRFNLAMNPVWRSNGASVSNSFTPSGPLYQGSPSYNPRFNNGFGEITLVNLFPSYNSTASSVSRSQHRPVSASKYNAVDDYDKFSDPVMDNTLITHLEIVESLSQLAKREKKHGSSTTTPTNSKSGIDLKDSALSIKSITPESRVRVDLPASEVRGAGDSECRGVQSNSENSIGSAVGGDLVPLGVNSKPSNSVANRHVGGNSVSSSGGVFSGVHNVHLNIMNVKDFREFWGVLNNDDGV